MEWGTGICRCCLSQGEASHKDLNTTNFWMGEEEVYSEMLKECFDITLSISDPVGDSGICEMCITQLRNSFNFKKQVLHSEEQFLKRIHERIKEEESRELIKSETEDFSDDDYEPEYLDESLLTIEKVDVPIKGEMDDEEPSSSRKRTRASTKPTLKAKKAKKDDKCTKSKTQTSKSRVRKRSPTPKAVSGIKKKIKVIFERISQRDKHLTNIRTVLEFSNVSPFKDATRNISCQFCKNVFINGVDFRQHSRTSHSDERSKFIIQRKGLGGYTVKVDITDLQCSLCQAEMSDLTALRQHLQDDHKKKLYPEIADRFLPFKLNDLQNFQCVMCNFTVDNFKLLNIHMNSHFNNYCCDLCGIGFVTTHRLRMHMARHRPGNFPCSYCDKVFQSKAKCNTHERGAHLGSWDRCKCYHCDEKYSNSYMRDQHMEQVHGIEPRKYECKACERVFLMKVNLNKHVRKDHLLERKMKCSYCPKEFFSKKQLNNHIIAHTGERPHECDICHKTYSRKKTLTEHLKIHYNDRRFKCPVCEQAFVQKSSMNSHIQTHHPDYPQMQQQSFLLITNI